MDPVTTIPVPDALPVSAFFLEILLIGLFVLHLLLMNSVVGVIIITLFTPARTGPANPGLAMCRTTSRQVPTMLALTINLGVAPLLFLQALYGQFFFTSSVLMASWWLALVGILIIAYYGLYYHALGFQGPTPARRLVLAVSLALLLFVAFLFVNNMTLMLAPERWAMILDAPSEFFLNTGEPSVIPRFLHFMTAAVAVGGMFIALAWRRKALAGDPEAAAVMNRGLNWFVAATLAQILFGTLFFLALPGNIQGLLLGGSASLTGTFGFALAMAAISVALAAKRKAAFAAAFLVLSVAGMVMIRHLVRKAWLSPWFTLDDLPVTGDSSSFIAFLASLVIGAACLAYLVKLSNRAAPAAGKEA